MIGISYYHHGSITFEMNVFENKEEAKQWFISECIKIKILDCWCAYNEETGKYEDYYTEEEIVKCLQKISIEEIVEGMMMGGGIEVKLVCK